MDLINRDYLLDLLEAELKKHKCVDDYHEGFSDAISIVECAFVEDINELTKTDNPYQE